MVRDGGKNLYRKDMYFSISQSKIVRETLDHDLKFFGEKKEEKCQKCLYLAYDPLKYVMLSFLF